MSPDGADESSTVYLSSGTIDITKERQCDRRSDLQPSTSATLARPIPLRQPVPVATAPLTSSAGIPLLGMYMARLAETYGGSVWRSAQPQLSQQAPGEERISSPLLFDGRSSVMSQGTVAETIVARPAREKQKKAANPPIDKSEDRFEWLQHYDILIVSISTKQVNEKAEIGHLEKELDPSVCSICADRASGLHYGIYTCEGCKGFFKRTVQNKRSYGCASGRRDCEVSRTDRNRCQFCRFQRCLRKGMVIEAVREDRMPGGRNGSAIYGIYKMKPRRSTRRSLAEKSPPSASSSASKTTSTKRSTARSTVLDTPPASTVAPANCPVTTTTVVRTEDEEESELPTSVVRRGTSQNLIQDMLEIDRIDRLINLRGLRMQTVREGDSINACQRLSRIGDEIVEALVEWTKQLPFYCELPIEVHTHLLTQRWAELVLLTACHYASSSVTSSENVDQGRDDVVSTTIIDEHQEVSLFDADVNLQLLQKRLSAVLGKPLPLEHVVREAGELVEKFTALLYAFSRLRLSADAYVCVKAITLLQYTPSPHGTGLLNAAQIRRVGVIQDQFVKALQCHLMQADEGATARLTDILSWLPILHSASSVLLHSKMFYVPFLICKCPQPTNFD